VFGSRKDSFGTIWKVPIEGGESIQLTDYQAGSPRFSPDGKTIACEIASGSRAVNGKIVIISADGGQPLKSFQTIPFGHNYNFIQWTPDGKGIIFLKAKDAVFNLWKQNLSGEPPQQITDFPLFAIWNFTYSHDGKRLLTSRGSNFVDNVLIKDFR
jgi:Tol biopolymer transport system component